MKTLRFIVLAALLVGLTPLAGYAAGLWLYEQATPDSHWGMSSDSIALELARQLNAERLIVVKSCAVDPAASLAELSDAGVLDRRFAAIAAGAGFPIDVVHRAELPRMRSLLLGEVRLSST